MSKPATIPPIIQGGMGIAVSGWRLAKTVASTGQLGVVSGTGIDTVLARRLQDGDPDGHMRRAMAAFPIPGVVESVLKRYFIPGGRAKDTPYRAVPMTRQGTGNSRQLLNVLAGYVEVFLAREGHQGMIGMNLLTKVQQYTLPTLYGAMLAGVNVVLMGAGIPREIPAALDQLAVHEPASLRFEVEGLPPGMEERLTLTPREFWDIEPPAIERPQFLAIIASNSLATMLARKATGRVDGFVVEGPTAGGHNAPPRGKPVYNDRGEPQYGQRDVVDLDKLAELGLPFWLAGGSGRKGALAKAQAAGATGIQVGTLFAYTNESGLDPSLKHDVLRQVALGNVEIVTDSRASPTGYPFKVVSFPGAPDPAARTRICDMGYLRVPYYTPEGKIGYRCASEPVEDYVKKGGKIEDTVGRQCLCNALAADIGMAQVRPDGAVEPPLLTSGDDLASMHDFLGDRTEYGAVEVVEYLLG